MKKLVMIMLVMVSLNVVADDNDEMKYYMCKLNEMNVESYIRGRYIGVTYSDFYENLKDVDGKVRTENLEILNYVYDLILYPDENSKYVDEQIAETKSLFFKQCINE